LSPRAVRIVKLDSDSSAMSNSACHAVDADRAVDQRPHPVVVADGNGKIELGHPCSCCGDRKSEIGGQKSEVRKLETRERKIGAPTSQLPISSFRFLTSISP
jgi:hypothetical protein